MPLVQFCDSSVFFSDLALQSHDWTKGEPKEILSSFANMKEKQTYKQKKIPQTLGRHVQSIFFFLKVCAHFFDFVLVFWPVRCSFSLSFSVTCVSLSAHQSLERSFSAGREGDSHISQTEKSQTRMHKHTRRSATNCRPITHTISQDDFLLSVKSSLHN